MDIPARRGQALDPSTGPAQAAEWLGGQTAVPPGRQVAGWPGQADGGLSGQEAGPAGGRMARWPGSQAVGCIE